LLRSDTLDKHTLELVKELQALPGLQRIRLVGGTALALQLGHRLSVDLDLFGDSIPGAAELLDTLKDNGLKPLLNYSSTRIAQFVINDVKVDFVNYPYRWLERPIEEDGIRLAGLQDITAMKLEAITNRGTRRDFVDIYFLLMMFPLKQQLDWYLQKYPDGSSFNVLRSLTYFTDAEAMPMPKMLIPVEWDKIKSVVRTAVREMNA